MPFCLYVFTGPLPASGAHVRAACRRPGAAAGTRGGGLAARMGLHRRFVYVAVRVRWGGRLGSRW